MNHTVIFFAIGVILVFFLVLLMVRFSGIRRKGGVKVTYSEQAQAKQQAEQEAKKASSAANNALRLFIVRVTRFAAKHHLELLMPANVVYGDTACRLTFLLVGSGGVLGVKSIRFGGEVQGNVSAPAWLRRENGQESEFKNPLLGCEEDKATLQKLLADHGLSDMPIDCVTVFINPKVQVNAPDAVRYFTEQGLFDALEDGTLCPSADCDAAKAAEVLRGFIPAAQ